MSLQTSQTATPHTLCPRDGTKSLLPGGLGKRGEPHPLRSCRHTLAAAVALLLAAWPVNLSGDDTAARQALEADLKKIADNNVSLEGAKAQQMLKLLDALEDHEDVQNVWENSEISTEDLEAASA